MKVDAINNYRFNNAVFEGRKNKETQKPAHITSPVRAIPLAVLIAMSPLNAPVINAQQTIPGNNKTLVEKKKNAQTYEYKNATPGNAFNCKMNYIGDNKNAPENKNIQLVFYRSQPIIARYSDGTEAVSGYKNYSNTIDFKKIKKVNLEIYGTFDDVKYENRYFVEGPGTKSVETTDLKGKVVGTKTQKCGNIKMEISKDLFDELKSTMNKDVEYKEETQLYED